MNPVVISIFFKGRVSKFFLMLSWVPLGMIYGGKIVEMGRSDLKMVKNAKVAHF